VNPPIEPNPGYEFSQIEVEFCYLGEVRVSGGGSLEGADIAFAFELQMADHTRIAPDNLAYRGDELQQIGVVPQGDCARGWIVYQTPQGERPAFVLFAAKPHVLRWEL
jgi:hypothetical protein